MNFTIDFHNEAFKKTVAAIVCFLTVLNFYYLLTGRILTLLPLILQCSFLFFFAFNHKYYRNIGLLLFGLIMISGIFGLISSCASGLQLSLGSNETNFERLTFSSISISVIFSAIGLSVFRALLKHEVNNQDSRISRFISISDISIKKAIRDSLLIRAIILATSVLLGVLLSLLGRSELATSHSTYFNLFEHVLILILTSISVIKSKQNVLGQALLLSVLNWLILFPVSLIKGNMIFWLAASYIFALQAILAFLYSLLWNQIFRPQFADVANLTLRSPDAKADA